MRLLSRKFQVFRPEAVREQFPKIGLPHTALGKPVFGLFVLLERPGVVTGHEVDRHVV